MAIEIVEARPDETTLGAITDLHRRVWPDGFEPRDEKVRWAFAGNSLGRAPLLVAVGDGGAVLGVRGGIPWRVDLGDGHPQRVVQLHGTAIDESIRRQGVFSKLTLRFVELARAENIPLIYNVSVDASRAGYERMGWNYLDSMRSLFLVVRPLRFAQHLAGRSPRVRESVETCSQMAPRFDELEDLFSRRENGLKGRMHTVYDRNFFSWRFQSPNARWIGDPEAGFMVYQNRRRGNLSEMLIGDIWPGSQSVATLVRRGILHERPDIVASWTTMDHYLYRPLRKMGFLVQPGRSLNLGLRRPDNADPAVQCALMAADIDTF